MTRRTHITIANVCVTGQSCSLLRNNSTPIFVFAVAAHSSDLPCDLSAIAQTRSRGPAYLWDSPHKERHMTDEKQNPKQQSEQQPQQENKQPSGEQQDRKPVQTPQQQDSQKDQKNTEVKEKQPDQSQNRKAS